MKAKKSKKPIKSPKGISMREGELAMDAFAVSMAQILNPLPPKKKKGA